MQVKFYLSSGTLLGLIRRGSGSAVPRIAPQAHGARTPQRASQTENQSRKTRSTTRCSERGAAGAQVPVSRRRRTGTRPADPSERNYFIRTDRQAGAAAGRPGVPGLARVERSENKNPREGRAGGGGRSPKRRRPTGGALPDADTLGAPSGAPQTHSARRLTRRRHIRRAVWRAA